ncbi:MAG: hypothetical protein RLZZ273_1155, partial [Bacteroidota bacterium]
DEKLIVELNMKIKQLDLPAIPKKKKSNKKWVGCHDISFLPGSPL